MERGALSQLDWTACCPRRPAQLEDVSYWAVQIEWTMLCDRAALIYV